MLDFQWHAYTEKKNEAGCHSARKFQQDHFDENVCLKKIPSPVHELKVSQTFEANPRRTAGLEKKGRPSFAEQ